MIHIIISSVQPTDKQMFQDLSTEIVQYIFTMIETTQIINQLSYVCNNWLKLIQDDHLWYTINQQIFGGPNPKNLSNKVLCMKNLTEIKNMDPINQGQWAIKTHNNSLLHKILKQGHNLNFN